MLTSDLRGCLGAQWVLLPSGFCCASPGPRRPRFSRRVQAWLLGSCCRQEAQACLDPRQQPAQQPEQRLPLGLCGLWGSRPWRSYAGELGAQAVSGGPGWEVGLWRARVGPARLGKTRPLGWMEGFVALPPVFVG